MGDALNVAKWVHAFAEQAEKAERLRSDVMAQLATKTAQDLKSTQTDLVRVQQEKANAEAALQRLGADHSKLKNEKADAEAALQRLDAAFLQLKQDCNEREIETRNRESELETNLHAATQALRDAKAENHRLASIEEDHKALKTEHEQTRYAVTEGLSQLVASSRAIAAALPPQNVTATDDDVHALHNNGYALAKDAWVLVVKQLRACAAVAKFATSILLASDDAVRLLRWLSEHGVAVPAGYGDTMDDAHSLVTSASMVAGKALGGSLVLALTLQGQIGLVGHIADPSREKERAREVAQGRLHGVIDALRRAFNSSSIDMAQVQEIDNAIVDLRTGISEPIEQEHRPPPDTPQAATSAAHAAAQAEQKNRKEHYDRLLQDWPTDKEGKYMPPPPGNKKRGLAPSDLKMRELMVKGVVPEEFSGQLDEKSARLRDALLGTAVKF